MTGSFSRHVSEVAALVGQLSDGDLEGRVGKAVDVLTSALAARKPVLVCGNGGSASDAMHIAGELVGRFLLERPALNVIALPSNPAVLTAWGNDYAFETIFSRQVEAHAHPGGVLWALSTSGNSPNVVRALESARASEMITIGLAGQGGGKMAALCDILLDVPSRITPRVQEMHGVIYHYICEQVEARMSATPSKSAQKSPPDGPPDA